MKKFVIQSLKTIYFFCNENQGLRLNMSHRGEFFLITLLEKKNKKISALRLQAIEFS